MRNKLSVALLCLALTLVPSPTGIRDPQMAQYPDGVTPEPQHNEAPSESGMAEVEPIDSSLLSDQAEGDSEQTPAITLDSSALSLDLNGSLEASLVASISPEVPKGIVYHWTSSDPDVAMVSDTGEEATITGLRGGFSTITVQISSDDLQEPLTADCEVAVDEPLTGLALSADAIILSMGEEADSLGRLVALPQPGSHTETIVWDGKQDEEVVSFDPGHGTVRALQPGTALIVATASGGLSAQCKVLVRGAESANAETAPEKATSQRMLNGAPAALRAKDIALVDSAESQAQEGALRALVTQLERRPWEAFLAQRGPVAIEALAPAAAESKPEQTKGVDMPESPATEELVRFANDGTALGISIKDESVALQAGVFDAQGMLIDAPLSWNSSDTKVARVDDDGIVRPIKVGKAIITATSPSGASATCAITVHKTDAQSVKLFTESPMRLTLGKQMRPNVGYSPMHSYVPLKWSSSDAQVVRIDSQSGLMTAVGKGEATVTATSPDLPEASLTLEVRVSVPITSLRMYKDARRDDSHWRAQPGETRMLYVEIEPIWDMTSDTVIWSSSAPKIASVDKTTGEVTAHKPGKAVITAKASSGVKATCTVAVE